MSPSLYCDGQPRYSSFSRGDVVILTSLHPSDSKYKVKDKYENDFYTFEYEHPLFEGMVVLDQLFGGNRLHFRFPYIVHAT